MSVGEIVALLCAGVAAGTINTVVGSGTLITFPVLLAFGYAPVTANVSNTVGLVPGSVSGAYGYRRELAGQRGRALRLGAVALAGGITGAVLLLLLPSSAFRAIVPGFIALALVLTVAQPRINSRLARRDGAAAREQRGGLDAARGVPDGCLWRLLRSGPGDPAASDPGGGPREDLHRSNALKNVLAGLVNGVAGLYFIAGRMSAGCRRC